MLLNKKAQLTETFQPLIVPIILIVAIILILIIVRLVTSRVLQ